MGSSKGEGGVTVTSGVEILRNLSGEEDSKLSEAVETSDICDSFLKKLGSPVKLSQERDKVLLLFDRRPDIPRAGTNFLVSLGKACSKGIDRFLCS